MKRKVLSHVVFCFLAANAHAQESGTLHKIKETNLIALGHRESSVPFSYYDDRQQVVGYSREFQLRVVEAVKKKLGLPGVQVRDIPVTSQNRIPLVQNGTVDIECGSTTNDLERQKQVAFTNTIFIIGTRLLTAKDSGVKDFSDLKGKTVVTTAGTTSERLLRKMNNEKQMGMSIISAKDHSESFQALETGRAVAYMNDDAILSGARARARQPDNWEIVGSPQSREAYGCMVRRDDPSFKKIADDAIADMEKSGEAAKIYAKWFQSPIPPKNLNLNFPMSEAVKHLYNNPSDKALD
ncbi:glutamate/aspartate ABC transporter substrate-binding protein [Paraburkholderia sp. BL25I1N1]|uniref:glutamate/aspartate ABC transporter substrate-binding protein n=1 Tax=Paraburkholderia sp. BL25I1N1 TaxID=1938804 RepID=UPI000D07D4DD|nr:glutamate/aspartate ABC transporter substrate-binding protein [Paraburkholderia sp. BL25I1N1]PRX96414.1 L-glutamate-binding protein /L-aspartate-binding protein [Paraburkholderia sp. BL25I1N1]